MWLLTFIESCLNTYEPGDKILVADIINKLLTPIDIDNFNKFQLKLSMWTLHSTKYEDALKYYVYKLVKFVIGLIYIVGLYYVITEGEEEDTGF